MTYYGTTSCTLLCSTAGVSRGYNHPLLLRYYFLISNKENYHLNQWLADQFYFSCDKQLLCMIVKNGKWRTFWPYLSNLIILIDLRFIYFYPMIAPYINENFKKHNTSIWLSDKLLYDKKLIIVLNVPNFLLDLQSKRNCS